MGSTLLQGAAAAADNWNVFDNGYEEKQAAAERAAYSAYKRANKKEGKLCRGA